jgi:hypothetical protein
MTGPRGTSPFVKNDAMCQTMIHPRVCRGVCLVSNRTTMSLPCQHATVSAMSACATCHPYSGDTCHPLTSPIPVVHHITCHVSSPGASTSVVRLVQSACHVALYGLYSHPFFCLFGFSNRMRYLSHMNPA